MSWEGKAKLKEIFTCWLSTSLTLGQFSRDRFVILQLGKFLNVVLNVEHWTQIFKSLKRWVYNSITFFFELKCLKETLVNFLSICSGNFFMFSLISKLLHFDYFFGKVNQRF